MSNRSEEQKLVDFFNDEGFSLGHQGDNRLWTPAETAIAAMRLLLTNDPAVRLNIDHGPFRGRLDR